MHETRTIEVKLTDAEVLERANEIAQAQHDRGTIEAEKKSAMNEFRSRLEANGLHINQLAYTIKTRTEMRGVTCRSIFHSPAPGMKRVVRTDTGEIVADEPMTPEELQRQIPFGDGEAEGAVQ